MNDSYKNHTQDTKTGSNNIKKGSTGPIDYRLLFTEMLEGFCLHEIICNNDGIPIDYRFLEMNPAFEKLTGLKSEFTIGKTALEVMPDLEPYWIEMYGKVALTGESIAFANYSAALKKHYHVAAYCPVHGQFAVLFTDITEKTITEEALLKSEAKYRSLIENSGTGVGLYDLDGRIMMFNQKALENMNGNLEDFVGKYLWEIFGQEIGGAYLRRIQLATQSDQPLVYEDCLQTPNGMVWFQSNHSKVYDGKGAVIGIQVVAHDITKIKQADAEVRSLNTQLSKMIEEIQQRVEDRTAQLEASNKELEAFSYSVSHDLRAPLRAIDGYSTILMEDHLEHLDEDGKNLLCSIKENSQKMAQLINDLLEFSQLSRSEIILSKVDMYEQVQSTLKDLAMDPQFENIEFNVGKLPHAKGDASMIHQIWVNLISNAIKYTAQKEHPLIEIGSKDEGGSVTYFVRDNGIGFDMKYYDKLFGVFERLHPASDYPGTGVGLALVQRIINKHGGRVWASSTEGEGTEFFFTIPG